MAAKQKVREIETPSGTSRATISAPATGRVGAGGWFIVGHGAGGGIEAPDLIAVTTELVAAGWTVARVEQPYRVKGRRAPEAAPRLDAAWIPVVRALAARRTGPLVVSGRSSGARVACRTAAVVGADAVVALAFPLHPPGRPEKSRAGELLSVEVPALVVQGERDPFGAAAEFPSLPAGMTLRTVPGDHSLRPGAAAAASAIVVWLTEVCG